MPDPRGSKGLGETYPAEAAADQLRQIYPPGVNQGRRSAAIVGAAGCCARDIQLLVVHEVRVELDGRPVFGQPTEEVDAPSDGSQLQGALLAACEGAATMTTSAP